MYLIFEFVLQSQLTVLHAFCSHLLGPTADHVWKKDPSGLRTYLVMRPLSTNDPNPILASL